MTTQHAIDSFSTYQRTRSFSRHTIRRRRTSLSSLGRWIAPMPLTAATAELVEEWLGTFATPRTKHAYRSDVAAVGVLGAGRGEGAEPFLDQLGGRRGQRHRGDPAPEAGQRCAATADRVAAERSGALVGREAVDGVLGGHGVGLSGPGLGTGTTDR